jgi:carbamoyl-phosphate synthase small subunit
MTPPTAKLALEDGTIFTGRGFGAAGETLGEVVFNTSMTGYQEVLTDPSYTGQIVTMTYPLIGNYGTTGEDQESSRVQVAGFIVRELTRVPSNFRSQLDLDSYLRDSKVTGIEGIDTRALVRKLRTRGAMNGIVSTTDLDDASLVAKARAFPSMAGLDLVSKVVPQK